MVPREIDAVGLRKYHAARAQIAHALTAVSPPFTGLKHSATIEGVFNVILFQPEIPPNTGNVIRLCANTGCTLHLIEPLGFSMEDRYMRRAGLDYHEYAATHKHATWEAFLAACQPQANRIFAFTTRGSHSVFAQEFKAGDWLLFGSETAGLPEALRNSFPPEQRLRLPMREGQRSLNLSNAVAVSVFEAWRQNGFAGVSQTR